MKHVCLAGTAEPGTGRVTTITSQTRNGGRASPFARALLACAATAAIGIASVNAAGAATLDDVVARLNALEASNHQLAKENAELRKKFGSVESTKVKSSKEVSKEVSKEISKQVAARVAQQGGPASPNYNTIIPFVPVRGAIDNGVAHAFLEKEKGDKLSFLTPNGEILLYGHLNVSLDDATKGIGQLRGPDGNSPIGNVGWMGDIASNKSFVGVRGFQNIGSTPFKFVYQLETLVAVTSQSGSNQTNSSSSSVVAGGLTSRNSFVGIASPDWGIVRVGKTDAPYAQSTARMDPFSGMIGSMSVIMGNTGGDNRVEFGTRLDHSIWYESPDEHGFKLAALFSPGQNRGYQNDNIAAGESDCTGGNIPGSGGVGGLQANSCSDGSFGNAASFSLTYENGPLYAVAAYERHFDVNRSSDIGQLGGGGVGMYANAPQFLIQADTADEDAAKIAVQYKFKTNTTVSAIVEDMHRYIPSYLEFQNERQRFGTWLAIEQKLTPIDSVAFGWAHAFKTPGDPGQHNDSYYPAPFSTTGDTTGGPNADNTANMFSAVYKRQLMPGLFWYTNVAATLNGPAAHYDLGAGGAGVTTDCHDGYGANGGVGSNPHCWTGGQLMGVQTGLDWSF